MLFASSDGRLLCRITSLQGALHHDHNMAERIFPGGSLAALKKFAGMRSSLCRV